jgi:hypothetical protein
MNKIENLFEIIGRYDHYIEIANAKANYILAFAISLSIAISAMAGYADILKLTSSRSILDLLKYLAIASYAINVIFLLQILFGVHKVIFPNTRSPSTLKKSHIFFGDVASLNHIEYATSFNNLDEASFIEDLSFQVNALAKIAQDKFDHQKRVMRVTSQQYILSALTVSILCGIIKALS